MYSSSSSYSLCSRKWSRSFATHVVALSGGVDSAVAAALTSQNLTTAIHMSNWNHRLDSEDENVSCSSDTDRADAVQVAALLQLPLHHLRFESDYWCHVFAPYVEQLMDGAMGSPDLDCNRHVKFGALLQHLQQRWGPDTTLTTGHYARLWYRHHAPNHNHTTLPACVEEAVATDPARWAAELDWLRTWALPNNAPLPPLLLSARDATKDQSYFLSSCAATAFYNVHFPLGEMYKKKKCPTNANDSLSEEEDLSEDLQPSVREVAAALQLPVAHKADSRGLCFVGPRAHGDFMARFLPLPPRKLQFVSIDTGAVIHRTATPQHAVLCTPGQGMRIGGARERYFCVHHHWTAAHWQPVSADTATSVRDSDYHSITVCPGTHHPALYSDTLYVEAIQWWCQVPERLWKEGFLRVQCRIRNLFPLTDCTIRLLPEQPNEHPWPLACFTLIELDQPLRGITRGQRVVFYTLNGLVCLGNAIIVAPGPSYLEQGRSLQPLLLQESHVEPESVVT